MKEIIKLAAAIILTKVGSVADVLTSAGNQATTDNQMRQHDQWLRQARRLAGNRFYTGPQLTQDYLQQRGGVWANPEFRNALRNLTQQAYVDTMKSVPNIGMAIANPDAAVVNADNKIEGTLRQTVSGNGAQPTWAQYFGGFNPEGVFGPFYRNPDRNRDARLNAVENAFNRGGPSNDYAPGNLSSAQANPLEQRHNPGFEVPNVIRPQDTARQ